MPEPTSPRDVTVVAAPFPPRLDGSHGGSRAIAQLLVRLADRHASRARGAAAPGDPRVDESVRHACDLAVLKSRFRRSDDPSGRAREPRTAPSRPVSGHADLGCRADDCGFGECFAGCRSTGGRTSFNSSTGSWASSSLLQVDGEAVLVDHDPDFGPGASSRLLAPVEGGLGRSLGRPHTRRRARGVDRERDPRIVESPARRRSSVFHSVTSCPSRSRPVGTEPRAFCSGASSIRRMSTARCGLRGNLPSGARARAHSQLATRRVAGAAQRARAVGERDHCPCGRSRRSVRI